MDRTARVHAISVAHWSGPGDRTVGFVQGAYLAVINRVGRVGEKSLVSPVLIRSSGDSNRWTLGALGLNLPERTS
jgi:hypothetical protein